MIIFLNCPLLKFFYIVILVTPEESARKKVTELTDLMDQGFNFLLFLLLVSIASLSVVVIVVSILFSERVVRPLTQLTRFAQRVNLSGHQIITKELRNNLDNIEVKIFL